MRLFISVMHPEIPSHQVIHPTHRCFDDALELLERRVRHEPEIATNNTVLLVHGVIRVEDQGEVKRFTHGWLEERRADGSFIVWDHGIWQGARILFSVEIAEFYGASRVERDSI